MIRVKKKAATMIAAIFIMIMMIGVSPGYAVICENGAGTGYDESNVPEGSAAGNPELSIEDYVERGAGYFLMAKKEVDTMLRMVELQNIEGLSIAELKAVVERALNHMNHSMNAYTILISRIENTPYDKGMISRLKSLDYKGFMVQNRLNPDIFKKVEGFLKNGDINGIFKRKTPIFLTVINLLKEAKADLGKNNIPKLPVLWSLNETFSQSSMFGSYVARIFQFLNVNEKNKSTLEKQNDWK